MNQTEVLVEIGRMLGLRLPVSKDEVLDAARRLVLERDRARAAIHEALRSVDSEQCPMCEVQRILRSGTAPLPMGRQ